MTSGPTLLATALGWAGIGAIVIGFLLGVAAGPRPSRWERGMDGRGLLRRVRLRAVGPDLRLQRLAVAMIWLGTATLVIAAALIRHFNLWIT